MEDGISQFPRARRNSALRQVVAILSGQPYQRGAQCLGRLLDKRLEVDDVVARLVGIRVRGWVF